MLFRSWDKLRHTNNINEFIDNLVRLMWQTSAKLFSARTWAFRQGVGRSARAVRAVRVQSYILLSFAVCFTGHIYVGTLFTLHFSPKW